MATRMLQIFEGRRGKFKKVREHDYIYDPLFMVSGERDFERQAQQSSMATAQYTIHPVFKTMFSEVKKYNRVQILCHPNARLPPHLERSYRGTGAARRTLQEATHTIEGAERTLYYAAPKVQSTMSVRVEAPPGHEVAALDLPGEEILEKTQSVGVQTLFRESSAQTDPYQPDGRIHRRCKEIPEIMLLQDIKFGPPEVAVHWGAVRAVQRQRVRRAWLQRVMDARALGALEEYDRSFREKELESILLLQEQQLGPRVVSVVDRGLGGRRWQQGARSLHRKVQDIKRGKERELRKLELKHSRRYPRRGSAQKEQRCPSTLVRRPLRIAIDMDYLPCDVELNPQMVNLNPPGGLKDGICDKMSRRNDQCLEQLTQDLKDAAAARAAESDGDEDEDWIKRPSMEVGTGSGECFAPPAKQREQDREAAADALLALLKGRAAQSKIYEGLARNAELISELQLPKISEPGHRKSQEASAWFHDISNRVIGRVLDLLNKELDHIMEEREQKDFVNAAISERQSREAAEAGRRQQEERRRREHQEMYEQIVLVTKQAAAVRLHDLFVEVCNRDAQEQAENRAELEADKIERQFNRTSTRVDPLKDEDLIAELVMDSILPEVVKRIERTQRNLKMAATPGIIMDAVFGSETVIQGRDIYEETSSTEDEEDLTGSCPCKEEEIDKLCVCIQEEAIEEDDFEAFEENTEDEEEEMTERLNLEDLDQKAQGDSVMELNTKVVEVGKGAMGEGQILEEERGDFVEGEGGIEVIIETEKVKDGMDKAKGKEEADTVEEEAKEETVQVKDVMDEAKGKDEANKIEEEVKEPAVEVADEGHSEEVKEDNEQKETEREDAKDETEGSEQTGATSEPDPQV